MSKREEKVVFFFFFFHFPKKIYHFKSFHFTSQADDFGIRWPYESSA